MTLERYIHLKYNDIHMSQTFGKGSWWNHNKACGYKCSFDYERVYEAMDDFKAMWSKYVRKELKKIQDEIDYYTNNFINNPYNLNRPEDLYPKVINRLQEELKYRKELY